MVTSPRVRQPDAAESSAFCVADIPAHASAQQMHMAGQRLPECLKGRRSSKLPLRDLNCNKLKAICCFICWILQMTCCAGTYEDANLPQDAAASSPVDLDDGDYLALFAALGESSQTAAIGFLNGLNLTAFPPKCTVFVPDQSSMSTIKTTAHMFVRTLRYHVVPFQLSFADLVVLELGTRLPTELEGQTILVTDNLVNSYSIDDVGVTRPDIYSDDRLTVHGTSGIFNFTVYGTDRAMSKAASPSTRPASHQTLVTDLRSDFLPQAATPDPHTPPAAHPPPPAAVSVADSHVFPPSTRPAHPPHAVSHVPPTPPIVFGKLLPPLSTVAAPHSSLPAHPPPAVSHVPPAPAIGFRSPLPPLSTIAAPHSIRSFSPAAEPAVVNEGLTPRPASSPSEKSGDFSRVPTAMPSNHTILDNGHELANGGPTQATNSEPYAAQVPASSLDCCDSLLDDIDHNAASMSILNFQYTALWILLCIFATIIQHAGWA